MRNRTNHKISKASKVSETPIINAYRVSNSTVLPTQVRRSHSRAGNAPGSSMLPFTFEAILNERSWQGINRCKIINIKQVGKQKTTPYQTYKKLALSVLFHNTLFQIIVIIERRCYLPWGSDSFKCKNDNWSFGSRRWRLSSQNNSITTKHGFHCCSSMAG